MNKGLLEEDNIDLEDNLQQYLPPVKAKRSEYTSSLNSSKDSHISVELMTENELLKNYELLEKSKA
jgi:hypothetical protein